MRCLLWIHPGEREKERGEWIPKLCQLSTAPLLNLSSWGRISEQAKPMCHNIPWRPIPQCQLPGAFLLCEWAHAHLSIYICIGVLCFPEDSLKNENTFIDVLFTSSKMHTFQVCTLNFNNSIQACDHLNQSTEHLSLQNVYPFAVNPNPNSKATTNLLSVTINSIFFF